MERVESCIAPMLSRRPRVAGCGVEVRQMGGLGRRELSATVSHHHWRGVAAILGHQSTKSRPAHGFV